MTRESKDSLNLFIMLPGALPFIFIGINLLYPLFGVLSVDGTFPNAEFYNHHFLDNWVLLFAIPYM